MVAHGRVRRGHRAGPHRPDVHVHELPQARPTSPRSPPPSTSSPRAGSRWASAPGWYEHEWRAYGYGFPTAGERLARLREGVEIFRQMWTTGTATYAGEHYQVDGAMCFPRPLQGTAFEGSERNGIPMWVAGGGERKTLRIAAEYADYTNFLGDARGVRAQERRSCSSTARTSGVTSTRSPGPRTSTSSSAATTRRSQERFAWIENHLRSAGVPDDAVARSMKTYREGTAVGTPDQVASALADMQDLGMTYAITNFVESAYDLSGVELFEREVIPALR